MSDPYHGFQPTTLIWEPPPAAKCQDCGSDNDGDSLWSERWCQMCWEKNSGNVIGIVDKEIQNNTGA